MSVIASVGELVQLPFLVTDVDGLTPVGGLADGVFSKTLVLDDTVSALVMTVSEATGVSGRYVAEFTPDTAGLWYVEVATPYDDFFTCYIEVGAPPDDVVDAIVAGVWGELLPGTFPSGSAGYHLGTLSTAVVAADLLADFAGSTRLRVLTDSAAPDDFYNGLQVVVASNEGIVARRIVDFENADGAITFDRELPFDIDDDDQILILGRIGEVVVDGDSALAIKLREVHQLLGLDAENPLCITKKKQETGSIVLQQTEVGGTLKVQREDP